MQNVRRPSFAVQGAYVVVTWNPPLPNQSYCNEASASRVAEQLTGGTVASEKLPLSRFTCPAVALELGGQTTLSQAGTTGTLAYHATLVLTRVLTGTAP